MKTIKRSPFCGVETIQSFINRNAYVMTTNEVPTVDDAKENLQIKSNEANEAYTKLTETIEQIKQTIANNVHDVASSIETLKYDIENKKKHREELIRTELDMTDTEQKHAIDEKIEKLHDNESDNRIRLNILNEKLKAAQSIPDNLKTQLDISFDEAKCAENDLVMARHTYVDALENQVNQLLTEASNFMLGFTYTSSKANDMLKSSGLAPEEKKVKPVQAKEPGQHYINPITGKEINPFSALEAKEIENHYNR